VRGVRWRGSRWRRSFPIVRDGLIYAVNIRNGLYIMRYTGKRSREVSRLDFLEGNSNLGDAVRLD
jgi:hypothetical protein